MGGIVLPCPGMVSLRYGGYEGTLCEKLLPCPVESVPAGSRVDLLLCTAQPTSGSGRASGCFRTQHNSSQGEEGEHVRETILQTPRSVKEQEEVLH